MIGKTLVGKSPRQPFKPLHFSSHNFQRRLVLCRPQSLLNREITPQANSKSGLKRFYQAAETVKTVQGARGFA